ncbi:toll/interleukin-1 receptor domain-containing protein [Clostridium sp. Marseille-Q2269]|uniref:toll/interleukin-1 receptor domain-containing protein n=1 Tax=Clostridium sp. Marseille-Q2269 TaxID=2942205 RepID=UPI0020742880|nr:toll/interleukin-1 receptor domain-containing protein [Clostridium sp. Marseille-Q2269]
MVIPKVKVFISYAHDTEQFADKVLEFSNTLRSYNIDANIDQYEESPPEGWPRWMDNQIENSDYVLIVCTQLYYDKVMNFKSGGGKGVNWELNIIYQYLYETCCNNTKFIPIIFNDYSTTKILKPLQSSTYYYVDRGKDFKKLCNRLKGIKNTIKPPLGKVGENILPPKERKNMFVTSMIDLKSWDKAKWSGVAYKFDPRNETPPLMALLYKDKESASKIFKDWKKLCGENVFKDIEISIIEKKNVGRADGYFVHITTNMDECIKRAEKQGFFVDETFFAIFSRYQYMDINVFRNNLAIFKKQVEVKKEFFIAPAVVSDNNKTIEMDNIELGTHLKIKMDNIKFMNFEDVTKNDIEYSVVAMPNYAL